MNEMKRQRLVSSFTPSGLQEWLEQELENRGIDSFYARSVISLLQQDCVDIEPQECHHTRNRHLRVLHKYGGPENLYYITKSKHQKRKTWGKHILLTSTLPCCKAAAYDLERIMKKAAIDCLKTASDYDNDIEELVNEVWIKLKNKSMKGETEERAMRNCNTLADSFFIPPSSPTGEIEKYFAAFPPLSSQNEHSVEVTQQEMGKNDWWDKCILKKKTLSPNEETLNSNSPSFQVSKNMQPIVPYRSLKTIKNIFENSMMKSLTAVSIKKRIISETINSKVKTIIKNPSCSLSNLFIININNMLMNRRELLNYLSNSAIGKKTINDSLNAYLKTQATVQIFTSEHLNEFSVFILHDKMPVSIAYKESLQSCAVVINENLGQIPIKEFASSSKREEIDYKDSDVHLRKDSLFYPDYKYPCLESNVISAQPHDENNIETIANLVPCEEMFCNPINNELCSETKFYFVTEDSVIGRKNAFIDKDVDDDYVYDNSDAFHPFTEKISCNEDEKFIINHSFNPLNSSRTSDEPKSNFPDLEQNKYIENISSIQFENSPSDDEIYYSDEESNAILNACNEENFSVLLEAHLASKTDFHPVLENSLSSHELPKKSQNVEMEGISFLNASQYNPSLSLDTETKKIIINEESGQERLMVLKSSDDDEIYYSDEESNAILYDCYLKDFDVSSEAHLGMKTHFQPVLETVSQYDSSFTLDTETKKIIVNKKSGQELLKKILSIGNGNISELINCRGQFSSSYDRFSFIQPNDIEHNEGFEHFQKGVFEKESELLIEPRYPSETNSEQNIFASDLPEYVEDVQSGNDTNDKKWLFHWGDNHNFISRTWQKDFVPAEKNYNQPFYDVEVSAALCKEIKEDEDESLKGLSSVPGISKTIFESEVPKPKQNVHSNFITSQIRNLANGYDGKTALYFGTQGNRGFTADQIQFNGQGPIVNDFTFHNVGNEIVPALQCGTGYSVSFENNPLMAAASGSSAFSNSNENISSFKDYAEGGGWSLASDPVTDYYCDNPYESSCSVSNVDLEESSIGYLEFHQKKHCTSEPSDVELPTNKEIETQLHKRMKQKLVPRKRPCSFFLQGTCTRSDCKYSHDVSTITCRFWKEGSCFKGITCPFYHGFVKMDDKKYPDNSKCLRTHSPDLSYSLESEADFPSLSSTKSEVSKMKSAMNFLGPKRRQKEK